MIYPSAGMLSGQFIPGGPHLILYNYKENQWVRLLDWHHFTIYLFFGLLGVTNILCSTIRSLPPSFSKLMLLNALFVEGKYECFHLSFIIIGHLSSPLQQ